MQIYSHSCVQHETHQQMQAHATKYFIQCVRIKFHIFEHIHGVVLPRKLSWKMFSGVLHSLAAHPPDYAGIPVGQEQEWPQFIQVSILITESSA